MNKNERSAGKIEENVLGVVRLNWASKSDVFNIYIDRMLKPKLSCFYFQVL